MWLYAYCVSVRALLAEANVKLSRVGVVPAVDTSSSHDKRPGIGGMQLDTQLEELRNLQVTICYVSVSDLLFLTNMLLLFFFPKVCLQMRPFLSNMNIRVHSASDSNRCNVSVFCLVLEPSLPLPIR